MNRITILKTQVITTEDQPSKTVTREIRRTAAITLFEMPATIIQRVTESDGDVHVAWTVTAASFMKTYGEHHEALRRFRTRRRRFRM